MSCVCGRAEFKKGSVLISDYWLYVSLHGMCYQCGVWERIWNLYINDFPSEDE